MIKWKIKEECTWSDLDNLDYDLDYVEIYIFSAIIMLSFIKKINFKYLKQKYYHKETKFIK